MLGRRLGTKALQSLTAGSSWQALSTYEAASTIAVEAPADLRYVLPSDLKETLGIKQHQCMCWYEPSSPTARWYVSWPTQSPSDDGSSAKERVKIISPPYVHRLGTARVHVSACTQSDELSVARHAAFCRRHPPGHAVLVSNLPALSDSDAKERLKQLFSAYNLRQDPVFTDYRTHSALVSFTSPHEAAMAARQMHGAVLEQQRLQMTWWDR